LFEHIPEFKVNRTVGKKSTDGTIKGLNKGSVQTPTPQLTSTHLEAQE